MVADRDVVRRLTEEGFIGGDLAVIDELIADDFVDHDPAPGFAPTKEGYRQLAEVVVAAFSDRSTEFDEYLDTEDGRVVESWAMVGSHTGEAFGVPPSGQTVRIRGVEISRCSEGKLVEHWGAVDMSDFFEKAQAPSG